MDDFVIDRGVTRTHTLQMNVGEFTRPQYDRVGYSGSNGFTVAISTSLQTVTRKKVLGLVSI